MTTGVAHNPAMVHTLTIDCGGGGLKAAVVDESDALLSRPLRIPTPYPFPPDRFVRSLLDIADGLPPADRAAIGMPGMIRHGVVVATPHYVTTAGPHTAELIERARAMTQRGFKFITVGSDMGLVREGVAATLKALRG